MTSGILLLDKPLGLSSNAAVQRVKRLFGVRKAGHAGSLDPLATGMLPVCLGEATRVAGAITGARKRYRFAVQLGARTATGDCEGPVVEQAPVPTLQADGVRAALAGFLGPQQQIPPMYSALKRDGQPLYRLARAGIEVRREPRAIQIAELALQEIEGTTLDLEALCSKGTYIRVLAEDIARALGTCGHVVRLRRLYVEPFVAESMHTLAALEAGGPGGLPALIAADRALCALPAVTLGAQAAGRIAHGQSVSLPGCTLRGRVRLYDEHSRFMGLGEVDASGALRPRRLFPSALLPPSE